MARTFIAGDGLTAAGIDRRWLAGVLPRVDPDRVTVREAPRWFRAMWAKNIVAVAMPWGIYFTPEMVDRYEYGNDPGRLGRLLVHELTHIEQLRRMGAVRHIAQYFGDYLRGRIGRMGHWESYRTIRLEVEARRVADLVDGGPR